MITAVAVCLGACLAYAAAAPAAGRRLAPAAATRLLAAGAVVAAGCGGFVLAVLAAVWIGQIGEVAELGHWSPVALHADSPVPAVVGAVAGALLLPLAVLGLRLAASRCRALVRVHRDCRRLAGPGQVAVVDSAVPDAFTTPGLVGRIVVTTGLLSALDPDQQRALIAHERSHVVHRHTWWRLAADLAAAVNPLLRPTAATVAQATERWADEDAAATVGDRRLVARAVATAALAGRRRGPVPAATGGLVPQRVRALLAPPPRSRPLLAVTLVLVLLAGAVGAVGVERAGDSLFDHASVATADR
ncbi:M56 family metallopeptidase [Actinocatenispora rupis]|uniref:Peptidase M48 n=1 Tax=Actinocatenispora rupis TaxID=519421 RepID=A0A8J3JG92_9ACTN|nr:M56 family metallopeptidase [Actinocatenispora rupis]GID15822.1 peptidase M48 [Actinocatenispora rupis]